MDTDWKVTATHENRTRSFQCTKYKKVASAFGVRIVQMGKKNKKMEKYYPVSADFVLQARMRH